MLAGDERLGLRRGAGMRPDESMDTIFVKHIREQGPAWVAGLSTGDRIISVNGETVAGKSYAHVVQLIQQTLCNLYLLVVPMENDILQLVSKSHCNSTDIVQSAHGSLTLLLLFIIRDFRR